MHIFGKQPPYFGLTLSFVFPINHFPIFLLLSVHLDSSVFRWEKLNTHSSMGCSAHLSEPEFTRVRIQNDTRLGMPCREISLNQAMRTSCSDTVVLNRIVGFSSNRFPCKDGTQCAQNVGSRTRATVFLKHTHCSFRKQVWVRIGWGALKPVPSI